MIAAWNHRRRRTTASRRAGEARVGLDPVVAGILACPQDKGPLYFVPGDDLLYNPRLRKTYAVDGGIPVLLIDEATDADPASAAALDARIASGELTPTQEAEPAGEAVARAAHERSEHERDVTGDATEGAAR